MNKLMTMTLIVLFFVTTVSAGNIRGSGYKGKFKSATVVISSLMECEEYVEHLTAGEGEGYGAKLIYYDRLDVLEKGDTFTIIKKTGIYTKIVAHHLSGDRKGFSFEGWVLNAWLWE